MSTNVPTSKKFRGRHKFVCDVDGMTYASEFKRIRWDGAVVHVDNLEQRHSQDMIKAVKDDPSVKDPQLEQGHNSDQGDGYVYITETTEQLKALL